MKHIIPALALALAGAARAAVVTNAVAPAGLAFARWTGANVPARLAYRNPLVLPDGFSLAGVEAVFGPALYATPDGDGAADGSSWANATTLAHAVALATNSCVVVVGNGVHNLATELVVNKAVTVRGATGDWKDATLSKGSGTYRVVSLSGGAALHGVTIEKGKMNNNTAGVLVSGQLECNGILSACRVTKNHSYDGGFGTAVRVQNGQVLDCLIDGNYSSDGYGRSFQGIGLHISGGHALADGCVITNNYCNSANTCERNEGGGAGVYLAGGTLRNCVVAHNHISAAIDYPEDWAIGVRQVAGVVENCSIYDHWSQGILQTAIGCFTRTGGSVRNCIIDGCRNAENGTPLPNWRGDPAAFTNCFTAPAAGIAGGIPADQDAYFEADGIPALFAGSPLVDAGAAPGGGAAPLDLLGNRRVEGGAIDIGAVEYRADDAFRCPFFATRTSGVGSLQTTLVARPSHGASDVAYHWDFDGDGATDLSGTGAAGAAVSTNFTDLGIFTVTLCATNAAGEGARWSMAMKVAPATLFVVSGNPGAAPPYDSWESAAATIQNAVDFALPTCEVLVSNGTYAISKCLSISNGITLRGLTGNRDDVVIDAMRGCRAIDISADGAVVSALSFTQGRHPSISGAYVQRGLLTNCLFRACETYFAGGGATHPFLATVANLGGTVARCTLRGNQVFDVYSSAQINRAGGFYYQAHQNALADACVITNNDSGKIPGGAVGSANIVSGSARNLLVAHNTLAANGSRNALCATGAFVQNGRLENCSVVTNVFADDDGAAGKLRYAVHNAAGVVENTLVADHYRKTDGHPYACGFGETAGYTNNCLPAASAVPGAGNIEAAGPRLYNLDGAGVLRTTLASPLVNKGRNEPWMEGAADLYGCPRRFGAYVDIGAVELQRDAPTHLLLR